MNVPAPIPFAQIPNGGVFTGDLKTYLMKYTASDAINLANGLLVNGLTGDLPYTYFPGASLQLT